MSRLPIVNPNRFYTNKEIDLLSLLPNSMKETEVETFLRVFETYLNEMYEGSTKYIPPAQLESIPYTNLMIWTDNYQYITAPYGNLLNYFKVGDFVRRGSETKYYKISEVVDNSTLRLNELYQNEIPPSYYKTAYWDEFTLSDYTTFWVGGCSPVGMDYTVPEIYVRDQVNNRIFCSGSSIPYSTIATEIFGDYEFEFGFHRSSDSRYKNNTFGFILSPASSTLSYQLYYTSGTLQFLVEDGITTHVSAYIVIDEDEEDWTVNISRIRDTGKIRVNVSSLKNQSGTIPVGFTSAVGFFNRFTYEMSIIEPIASYVTLRLQNGVQQGWNYMYLESDLGFPGELDQHANTSSFIEPPESMYSYVSQMGQLFQNDGDIDIYQSYHDEGLLRLRNLTMTAHSFSATDFRSSLNHISILEKIRRLTELHDPDLIDIDYIQYFLNYLGYNVNINRETLGLFLQNNESAWSTFSDEDKQKLQDDYLRFIITTLPSWYRIKTTDNAIVIMLYSFGLVTELNHYFCTNYNDISTWRTEISGSDITISDQHYPTPHFGLFIDLDKSYTAYLNNPERMTAIIDAILSVKPINTVFRGFGGYFKRNLEVFVDAIMYSNQYIYLKHIPTEILGTELIGNPDFTTDTWWSKTGGSTISGGHGNPGPLGNLIGTVPVITGGTYRLEFTVLSGSGSYTVERNPASFYYHTGLFSVGSYSVDITIPIATTTSAFITFGSGAGAVIDNVSFKRVIVI